MAKTKVSLSPSDQDPPISKRLNAQIERAGRDLKTYARIDPDVTRTMCRVIRKFVGDVMAERRGGRNG